MTPLKDCISFILFTGFSISSLLPDHFTICRFRNHLLELNIYEKLMDEINSQIESKGLMVKEGAIVDATIIESSRRPRKVTEVMPEDRNEENTPSSVITYSKEKGLTTDIRATYDDKEGFILAQFERVIF